MDAKWFYVVPFKRKIRLYPSDDNPGDDKAKNKFNISRIMFLAAVKNPHALPDGTEFDGFRRGSGGTEIILNSCSRGRRVERGQCNCLNKARGTTRLYKEEVGSSVWKLEYEWMVLHLILAGDLYNLNSAGRRGGWNIVFDVQSSIARLKQVCVFFTDTSMLGIRSEQRANRLVIL